jgi:hypothetical protein
LQEPDEIAAMLVKQMNAGVIRGGKWREDKD